MTSLKNIRTDILYLLILLIIAIGVVFYKFVSIPNGLHFDEVEFARLALSLKNKPYTPYSPLATGHSTPYFYIILLSFQLLGVTPFALRLPAAIFAILTTALFYFLMKLVFSKEKYSFTLRFGGFIPFFATFIFITLGWYLNFARFAFETTFLLFLELISTYTFFKYRVNKPSESEGRKLGWVVTSGIFAGLAYNSYTPGRFFFALPLLFLILEFPFKKKFSWKNVKPILYFVISFVILILPLTLYLGGHKDTRVDELFFLGNKQMSVNEKAAGLWHNIVVTIEMFHIKGDVNGTHNYPNKPILNPILGILFIIGLVVSIKNWKNFYDKFFILYFLLSLFPTLLTYPSENPHMLRTFTAIPGLVYFLALSIVCILKIAPYKKIAIGVISLLIIFSSIYELRSYFYYHAPVLEQAFRMKKSLPYYIQHPNAKL